MSIFGVGVDIEDINRFTDKDRENHNSLLAKIYTERELDYCFSKKGYAKHLAARYCGKEAIIKALGSFGRRTLAYNKIEILNKASGAPSVSILTEGYDNIEIKVSLSHSKSNAIGFAVVWSK